MSSLVMTFVSKKLLRFWRLLEKLQFLAAAKIPSERAINHLNRQLIGPLIRLTLPRNKSQMFIFHGEEIQPKPKKKRKLIKEDNINQRNQESNTKMWHKRIRLPISKTKISPPQLPWQKLNKGKKGTNQTKRVSQQSTFHGIINRNLMIPKKQEVLLRMPHLRVPNHRRIFRKNRS